MKPKAKMGRPTDNPKTEQYRLRMSDEDAFMLNFCAEKTGKTKSDILREGIKIIYNRLVEKTERSDF
ncbi:MAG: hypothetical protein GX221_00375 [Candidatus Riflebacteria bacterium]|nr:hypothetical protein [Candidatus Riflebacteria bacterium]